MTVRIRRPDNERLVEVKGEAIGVAKSPTEARELAAYWSRMLKSVASLRIRQSQEPRRCPGRKQDSGATD